MSLLRAFRAIKIDRGLIYSLTASQASLLSARIIAKEKPYCGLSQLDPPYLTEKTCSWCWTAAIVGISAKWCGLERLSWDWQRRRWWCVKTTCFLYLIEMIFWISAWRRLVLWFYWAGTADCFIFCECPIWKNCAWPCNSFYFLRK